jgi:RimJ/RimL family protein N-acetyltransferase
MELTTPRLVLREFVEADAAAFRAYQADARAQEFYAPEEREPAPRGALVHLFIEWAAEVPRRNWQLAIAERAQPRGLVGSVGLRCAGAPSDAAEFGLELAPASWGQGYGTEAGRALLQWGFSAVPLAVVWGTTVSANTRVARLVRRLGFRAVAERVGQAWLADRGWREVQWEIRREEWHRLNN